MPKCPSFFVDDAGFKSRTSPEAVVAGIMWHAGDGTTAIGDIRHECSEQDGLGPYGWEEHDGVSYGRQSVNDRRSGVRLVTSMVKPAQLTVQDRSSLGHDTEGGSQWTPCLPRRVTGRGGCTIGLTFLLRAMHNHL